MTREVHYFSDPQLDRAVGLCLQLAAEVHVTTQRLHALEQLLIGKGLLSAGEVDVFQPNVEQRKQLDSVRDASMQRILRVITEDGPAEHPLRDELVRAPR